MARQGWAVFGLGLLLMLFGLYGLWTGWDQILLERGWSQFIAGATAVSGGVVTMALGRVINVLGRISASLGEKAREPAEAMAPSMAAKHAAEAGGAPTPKDNPAIEVDRYVADGAVYVMMSDGSVEVHRDGGRRRYPSLAALRAETGLQRR